MIGLGEDRDGRRFEGVIVWEIKLECKVCWCGCLGHGSVSRFGFAGNAGEDALLFFGGGWRGDVGAGGSAADDRGFVDRIV